MKDKIQVEESTPYESLIDAKAAAPKRASLAGILGVEEEDDSKEWEKHWVGMPEYVQENNPPYKKIYVHFRTKEDFEEFQELIGQPMSDKTKSIWHPKLAKDQNSLKRWIEE